MKKVLFKGSVVILCSMLYALCAFASGPGSTGANFLKIGVGARPIAMGETGVAIVDDVNTIWWNPAGLGNLNRKEITFMHNEWIDGINHDFLAFAYPLKYGRTLGASVNFLSMSKMEGYDEDGNATGGVGASDLALVLSYGEKDLDKRLNLLDLGISAGANLKFIRQQLGDESAIAFALDMGFLYSFSPVINLSWLNISNYKLPLNIGIAVQNLGTKIKFIDEGETLPVNCKLGAATKLLENRLNLAMDFNIPLDNDFFVSLGAEYRFWKGFNLRMGYISNQDLGDGLRVGMGMVSSDKLSADYAYVPYNNDIGNSHRISLGMKFGAKKLEGDVTNPPTKQKAEKFFKKGKKYFGKGEIVESKKGLKSPKTIKKYAKSLKYFVKAESLDEKSSKIQDWIKKAKMKLGIIVATTSPPVVTTSPIETIRAEVLEVEKRNDEVKAIIINVGSEDRRIKKNIKGVIYNPGRVQVGKIKIKEVFSTRSRCVIKGPLSDEINEDKAIVEITIKKKK